MDPLTRTSLENLHSQDRELQNRAFAAILAATQQPVDSKAQELIALEEDPQHRKKYAGAWCIK